MYTGSYIHTRRRYHFSPCNHVNRITTKNSFTQTGNGAKSRSGKLCLKNGKPSDASALNPILRPDADGASTPGTSSLGASSPGSGGSQPLSLSPPGSAGSGDWTGANAVDCSDTESENIGGGGEEEGSLPAKRLEYPPAKVR